MRINGHSNESLRVAAVDELKQVRASWRTPSSKMHGEVKKAVRSARSWRRMAAALWFLCALLTLCLVVQTCYLVRAGRPVKVQLVEGAESSKEVVSNVTTVDATPSGDGVRVGVGMMLESPTGPPDREVIRELGGLLQQRLTELEGKWDGDSLAEGLGRVSGELESVRRVQADQSADTKRTLAKLVSSVDRLQRFMAAFTCTGAYAARAGAGCYLFSGATRRTWAAARAHCHQVGGDLATVDSLDASRALHERAAQFNMSHFWIGLQTNNASVATESCRARRWTWIASGSTAAFTRWAPGEPNGCANDEMYTAAENCAEVWIGAQYDSGGWNDRSCLTLNPFVCEISPYEPARLRSSENY